MKNIIMLLLVLLGPQALAWKSSFAIQAESGTPIPSSANTGAKSLALQNLSQAKELCVFNETGSRVAMNTINWDASVVGISATHYIPSFGFICTTDAISSRVYIWGATGTIGDDGWVTGYAK